VGDSRRDAGFGLFYSELIWSIVRRAVCVYLGTSQTTVGVMLSYLQLLWLLVLLLFNETFLGPQGDSPLLDQTSSKNN
jgi:hypothetical protein